MSPVAKIKSVTSAAFIKNNTFEDAVIDVQAGLNALSPKVAKLAKMSYDVITPGDAENLGRLQEVSVNVTANLLVMLQKFEPNDPKIAAMKAQLDQLSAYLLGPNRIDVIDLKNISNEGKGEFKVGDRTVRYVVTPGKKATVQNERGLFAVDRLPDGSYKMAKGYFLSGEESGALVWNAFTWSRLDWEMDHENISKELQGWLTCAKSTCVPFSENKTVR